MKEQNLEKFNNAYKKFIKELNNIEEVSDAISGRKQNEIYSYILNTIEENIKNKPQRTLDEEIMFYNQEAKEEYGKVITKLLDLEIERNHIIDLSKKSVKGQMVLFDANCELTDPELEIKNIESKIKDIIKEIFNILPSQEIKSYLSFDKTPNGLVYYYCDNVISKFTFNEINKFDINKNIVK